MTVSAFGVDHADDIAKGLGGLGDFKAGRALMKPPSVGGQMHLPGMGSSGTGSLMENAGKLVQRGTNAMTSNKFGAKAASGLGQLKKPKVAMGMGAGIGATGLAYGRSNRGR